MARTKRRRGGSPIGKVFRSKKWAEQFAGKKRKVRKVKSGYKVVSK